MSSDLAPAVSGVAASAPPANALPTPAPPRPDSYREILASTLLIGGSSLLNLVIGMARTKAMAVLLGPAGYGLMSAYQSIIDLSRNIAQMGLTGSGVRQIAEAASSNDTTRIARTVKVLRWTSLACALVGALLLSALSGPVSTLSFGDDSHAGAVAWLSLAVLFSVVASGQGALLQGMRRISDMARIAAWGGLLGTAITIPMVYVLGEDGLVPALVAVAASALALSWWYSRRVGITATTLTFADMTSESAALLKLGMAFMASGLLMTGAAFVVRIIVLRKAGLDAAGIYHAAWTLGGLYIGFVLQALGTDFYPRLVGVARDNAECNRLVNEQALISMLLALPGVLGTLTLAPLAISLFYSAQFAPAVDVMRWICLGMAMRVLTWPIGFVVVAKNRQMLFFAPELAWAMTNVALTWYCVGFLGVDGAGIAFFLSCVFHGLVIYPIASHLSGFRWTAVNQRTALACLAIVWLVSTALRWLPPAVALAFGALATIASTCISIACLVRLVPVARLPGLVGRFLPVRRTVP